VCVRVMICQAVLLSTLLWSVSAQTLYVRSDGSASSPCGSLNTPASACKSVTEALKTVTTQLSANNKTWNIYVAAGTYTICSCPIISNYAYDGATVNVFGAGSATTIFNCAAGPWMVLNGLWNSISVSGVSSTGYSGDGRFIDIYGNFGSNYDVAFSLSDVKLSNLNASSKAPISLDTSTLTNSAHPQYTSFTISNTNFLFNTGIQAGAIYMNSACGGTVSVTNSVFQNNAASGPGGALNFDTYLRSKTCPTSYTFQNVVLANNSARGNGGAASFNMDPAVSLTNVQCSNNSASIIYSRGGCFNLVYINALPSLTAISSTFSSNFASSGGAVYLPGQSRLTITGSSFTSNRAQFSGGAFYIEELVNSSISSCIFTANQVINTEGGTFEVLTLRNFIIQDSIITLSSAGSSGGAIHLKGGFVVGTCTAFMRNLTISSSKSYDGAGLAVENYCTVNISNSFFYNLSASHYGGSVYLKGSSAFITNTVFDSCTSQKGTIYMTASLRQLGISSSNFTNNRATQYGGALWMSSQVTSSITSSYFANNRAENNGGGAIFQDNTGTITITRSTFLNNLAPGSLGGCVYLSPTTSATIDSSQFLSCSSGSGGAIYFKSASSFIVLNSTFSSNRADNNGGAVRVESLSSANSSISTFWNSQFNFNSASSGGGISSALPVNISVCSFSNNTAGTVGGGIFLQSSSNTVKSSQFTSNQAASGAGAYVQGQVNITTCSFSANVVSSSTGDGGGLFLLASSTSQLVSNTFSSNLASRGGGLWISLRSQVFVLQSNFTGNGASFGGGFAAINASNLTVANCSFLANIAVLGGGLHGDSWPASIRQTTFKSNAAYSASLDCADSNGAGGGMFVTTFKCYANRSLSSLTSGVLFDSNTASKYGGGLALDSISTLKCLSSQDFLTNFSFVNNSALYGSSFGTAAANLSLSSYYFSMNSSDKTVLGLRMFDYFGTPIVQETCDFTFSIENSTNKGLLIWAVTDSGISNFVLQNDTISPFYFKFGAASDNVNASLPVNMTVRVAAASLSVPITTTVRLCKPGQALLQDSFAFWRCQDCGTGEYLVMTDQKSCAVCPGGTYSYSLSTTCTICDVGKSSQSHSGNCASCTRGRYANVSGSVDCTDCPIGKYGDQTGATLCSNCPLGSATQVTASDDITKCICLAGFFGAPYLNKTCIACPKQDGVECNDDYVVPFVGKGHWRVPGSEDHVLDCIPSSACQEAGFNLSNTCGEGRTGRLCGECIPLKYFKLENGCKKCNTAPALMWVILISLILGFLILAFTLSKKVRKIPYVSYF
jgi:hypothetical protein